MNHLHRTFIFSFASLAFIAPAVAADPTKKSEQTGQSHDISLWRASDVIGSVVKNATNDNVGKIEDFLIDPQSGKVSSVIVSTGGFLGVAETLSSVPVSAFRYDAESKSFKVSLTKEEISSSKRFTTSEWKDSAASKAKEARNAVGGDVSKPDNSAKNERDMDGKTATPEDQGNNDLDVKLTKDIRSAVVASDLSFNAKNIKIISNGGRVVLRGVVDTAKEHGEILRIAKKAAGDAKITDQLEVKK